MLLASLIVFILLQFDPTIEVYHNVQLKALIKQTLITPFALVGIIAVGRLLRAAPKRRTPEFQISSLYSTQTSSHLLRNLS